MKRSRVIACLVVMTACLAASSVRMVIGQTDPYKIPPPPSSPTEERSSAPSFPLPQAAISQTSGRHQKQRQANQRSHRVTDFSAAPATLTRNSRANPLSPFDALAATQQPPRSRRHTRNQQSASSGPAPAVARLKQPTPYQINCPQYQQWPRFKTSQVRYRIPQGMRVLGCSDPKAVNDGDVLSWDVGSLVPAQEKRIDLQLVAETKAAFNCMAQVTFSGSSTLKVQVREPKLAIKAAMPEHVVLGDTATVSLTDVSNPGDGAADRVRLKATLADGLEYARGKVFEVELGSLAAGEESGVQLVCLATTSGIHVVDCIAQADAGLKAQDTAKVDVVLPRLDLVVSGPHLRYVDRHAVYSLKVTNPGSAPASNVSVVHQLPPGFKFDKATAGGREDFASRTVSWFIGDLMPGESREVQVEAVAVAVGEHKHVAVATGGRGLKTEAEVVTHVEGLSALMMELADTDDPIEVGAETTYEMRVTNTGSKMETNVELVCTVPDHMEFRAAKCNAGCRCRVEGREVIFEPLPKLAPRADAIYRVVVRGLAPGDMHFRARIRADGLSEAIMREESTKVYGDEVTPR